MISYHLIFLENKKERTQGYVLLKKTWKPCNFEHFLRSLQFLSNVHYNIKLFSLCFLKNIYESFEGLRIVKESLFSPPNLKYSILLHFNFSSLLSKFIIFPQIYPRISIYFRFIYHKNIHESGIFPFVIFLFKFFLSYIKTLNYSNFIVSK